MSDGVRDKLMRALRDLVLERGYAATSIDAICEQAQVSKGSFFHHFRSKEEAACQTLDVWMSTMAELVQQSKCFERPDPVERLFAYLDFLSHLMDSAHAPTGCLLGTLALELSDTHPEVREKAAAYFTQWSATITQLLCDALGESNGCDMAGLADHLVATIEGAILLAKAKRDRTLVRQSVEHFRHYMKSILDKNSV